MSDRYQELISAIKAQADCRSIFKRFWPDKYRERGNSLCPFHDDREPSMQLTADLAHCHAESLSLDAIDLYERGAGCSKGEAIRLLASELGLEPPQDVNRPRDTGPSSEYFRRRIQEAATRGLPEEALHYLERRGISSATIQRLKELEIVGWDLKLRGIAFPLFDWKQEKILGIQIIPPDGSKKRFIKGTDSKRAFFRFGSGTDFMVFCEGIVDALSVAEALQEAEAISLLGAGLINKLAEIDLRPVSVLFLDNDEAGREATAKILMKFGPRFRLVDWSLAPDGMKDVNDLLRAGHSHVIEEMIKTSKALSKDEIERITAPYGSRKSRQKAVQVESSDEANGRKQTQAQQLVLLAGDVELFHTADDVIYATFPMDGHKETWPVRSKSFRRWLAHRFYLDFEKPPGNQALQDAFNILEAKGQFEGELLDVFIRIASSQGRIYIDLANSAWEAVEISASDWSIVSEPPVKFRRTKGMLPLVYPERGGSLDSLKGFLNLPDDASLRLMVGWIIQAAHPTGPYPILNLEGEQGSGKSITARLLRSLIDPSTAPIRTIPREERDLLISATNGWIIAFDNLSGVPLWLSDALCRLSTGGGYAVRELYSNDEEMIFNATRPLLLTGIDQIAARHDLADRSIILHLPPIAEERRIPEKEIIESFQAAHPKLFGALCDAVSTALRNLPHTRLPAHPRMADFALWVSAAEPALPWGQGEFLNTYYGNRKETVELSLESDPVSSAIRELMASRNEWEGTSSELLDKLSEIVSEKIQKSQSWPKRGNTLSNRLKRSSTFLRAVGIEVEFFRLSGSGSRKIVLRANREKATGDNVRRETESTSTPAPDDWEEL